MNILHVVDCISQTRGGGSARVPWHLAKEQSKLGHRVAIWASDDRASQDDAPPGVELRLFKCWFNFMGGLRVTPTMLAANFSRWDIIHLHNYRTPPNLIAAIDTAPFVLQAHGSTLPIPQPRRRLTQWWKPVNDVVWRNVLMKRAARLIACNEDEIDQYVAEGAARGRCVLTDLGIDMDEYSDLPEQTEWGFVLYLGKFHHIKGPDLLAQAVQWVNDCDVLMAGWDDGYLATTRAIADGRVEFLGFADGRDKRQLYVDAEVTIFPSRYEAFGLGVVESCACGTRVIVTDRCARWRDSLPDYCGQVVPCDEVALAGAINRLLAEPDTPEARAKRIQWARGFGWDRIAREMVDLYREVLKYAKD
jgi:glycosyltransferase involved in cell wall biosynthesis